MLFGPEHVILQSFIAIHVIPVLDLPPVRAAFINCMIWTYYFTHSAIIAEAGYLYRHGLSFPDNKLIPNNRQILLFKYKHELNPKK